MIKDLREQADVQEQAEAKQVGKRRRSAAKGMSPDQFAAAVSRGEIK